MENLFATRLSDLLKETGLSKRNLAKLIGISAASVADWSNGKVQPTAENIYLTAKFFKVSSDYLLGLEDETGAKKY
ncbi:MAG: helix-turn-helix domain-containing protein [Clostridia bacterium]|nr:helix-turn-helix domain-containing protein [Clostridia bacterium]